MNFYDPGGLLLDYRRIEELAGHDGLSLRTGCFCNPGAGETAEGLTDEDMRAAFASDPDLTLPRFLHFMQQRNGQEHRRGPRVAGARQQTCPMSSAFSPSPPASVIERWTRSAG